MKKILSISVAAYNVSATLHEALNPFTKIRNLDLLDVLIINDGSSDNTAEIAQKYCDNFPGSFRLISKKNEGWGSVINTAVKYMSGKYYRHLDGDDFYDAENLEKFLSILEHSETDLIMTTFRTFRNDTHQWIQVKDCNPGCNTGEVLSLCCVPPFTPFIHSLTVKSELLKNSEFIISEHCFYTDVEFVLKACSLSSTIMFLDTPVYCYRCGATGQSMSLQGLQKHYEEQLQVIIECLHYKKHQIKRQDIILIFDKVLLETCYWLYMVMLLLPTSVQHKKFLIDYDKYLKIESPEYYKKINFVELRLLRLFRFRGYILFSRVYRLRKQRLLA